MPAKMTDDAKDEHERNENDLSVDDARSLPRRPRRLRRKLAIVAPLVALGALLLSAPWMVGRAVESDTACSDRDYHGTPGESESCAWRAHAWLVVPKLVPWTRTRALGWEADILNDQAERELRNAAEVTPDVARRDAAAKRFADASQTGPLKLERSDGSTVVIEPRENIVLMLDKYGAFAEAARQRDTTEDPLKQLTAYRASVRAGDLEAAVAIGARDRRPELDLDRLTGALACLQGDVALGEKLLGRSAEDAWTRLSDRNPVARLGQSVCRPDPKLEAVRDPSLASSARLLTPSSVAELPLDRLIELDRVDGNLHQKFELQKHRAAFVAAWLGMRARPLEEVLELIAPFAKELAGPVSPYVLELSHQWGRGAFDHRVIDPATHERAAETLEAMAAAIDAPAPAPMGKVAPEIPPSKKVVEPTLYQDADGPYKEAKANPRAALRGAARLYWLRAAAVHAELGRHADAARDAKRALALDASPETRLSVAALVLAGGDLAAAKAQLAALGEASTASDEARAYAGMLDALVAAREARWDDAHAAAKKAHGLAKGDQVVPAAWLAAAMAIRVGKPEEGPGLATPEGYERSATTWEKLAAMPEDTEKKQLRLRMFTYTSAFFDAALVMPAVFYVIGQATSAGSEAFIDTQVSSYLTRYGSPIGLRARAEAARWRDDEATAKALEERAAKVEALVDSPRTLLLAKLAGLM